MDTIFALASARGKAGVAVVRVSGPGATAAGTALCGRLPPPRRAGLRAISVAGEVVDQALVLRFEAGRSFTGEETVEFQLHGSLAVVRRVLEALGAMPGLRLAEPGEFTRRAMEAGRLDLTQVEGLADLIEAETEAQRRQAQRVLSGAMSARAAEWRSALVRAAALIEATIDFADEDVPVDVTPEVMALIEGLLASLRREERGGQVAERLRAGFEVAILGQPNVGKSTLLNALAGREAAITSDVAGTTRDVIEVRMDLGGLPVTLLDTAGIRDTEDPLERMGIDRALRRAEAADLRLFLVQAPGEALVMATSPGDLVVLAKADLAAAAGGLSVSGRTGQGIDALLAALAGELGARLAGDSVAMRHRHLVAIRSAIEALERARAEVEGGMGLAEVAAADVRQAVRAMDVLVGKLGVEDFLGEIFASFCIGK
ncbi:MAG: tRNA uridine-5-carboxymethylaminomethyl(34) synthesis GTPase MnmE [Paracoccaceae bacterium]